MSTLSELRKPIKLELDEFQKRFRQVMKSQVPLLDRITYYIVQRKGKQIRPMFVFLSAKIFAPITEQTYIGASLIELLHTATLVHDDVVDDSHMRRGFFSLNALWKNKIAVLVGDYLLSKGLLIALEAEQYDLLKIVSNAVKEISEGELLQFEKSRLLNITEEVYFEIIKQKTASLIAAACSAGAASTGASQEQIELMHQFGVNAGIAFQIKDDLFDYGYQNIGKPTGIDIKEKKMTLPLIYALSQAPKKEQKSVINLLKRTSEKKKSQKKIIEFVKSYQGMEYAEEQMNTYLEKARNILQSFPDGPSRTTLSDLLDFVVDRKS